MKHSNPLFEWESCFNITFNNWLVTHEESSHHLENWNFNREVERSNNTNWTQWPSISGGELSSMISRNSKCFSKESDLITAEIFKESSCNSNFSFSLSSTLWNRSNNGVNEKIKNFRIMENFSCLSTNCTEHEISFLILERVMKTMLWNSSQTVNEWLSFNHVSIRN